MLQVNSASMLDVLPVHLGWPAAVLAYTTCVHLHMFELIAFSLVAALMF